MNAKEVIDLVDKLVVRQDFDRPLALDCLNNVVREVYRSFTQHKFMDKTIEIEPVDGYIYIPELKSPEVVEYSNHKFGKINEKTILKKLISFDQILGVFKSASLEEPYTLGVPEYYMIVSEGIRVMPIPESGVISVYGEYFPSVLEDNINSLNNLTREAPYGLAYYTASYYFDMLAEADKAEYWRNKAQADLDNYNRQSRYQRTNNIPMFNANPLGNLPYKVGAALPCHRVTAIDTLDGGNWSDSHYHRAWA